MTHHPMFCVPSQLRIARLLVRVKEKTKDKNEWRRHFKIDPVPRAGILIPSYDLLVTNKGLGRTTPLCWFCVVIFFFNL